MSGCTSCQTPVRGGGGDEREVTDGNTGDYTGGGLLQAMRENKKQSPKIFCHDTCFTAPEEGTSGAYGMRTEQPDTRVCITFPPTNLLDVSGNVLLDVELFECLRGAIHGILLHVLCHVGILDHCLAFGCHFDMMKPARGKGACKQAMSQAIITIPIVLGTKDASQTHTNTPTQDTPKHTPRAQGSHSQAASPDEPNGLTIRMLEE